MDWYVTSTVVTTMRHIFVNILKNQASGGKWLIYEVTFDNFMLYIYFYGDEVDKVLKVELYQMV